MSHQDIFLIFLCFSVSGVMGFIMAGFFYETDLGFRHRPEGYRTPFIYYLIQAVCITFLLAGALKLILVVFLN